MTQALRDVVAATLHLPDALPATMTTISATVRYTRAAVGRGDPGERYDSLGFVIDSLQYLLAARFCQSVGTGQITAAPDDADTLVVRLSGRALSPLLIGQTVRMIARHHHAPYHPMMDLTGATPLDYADTVASLSIAVNPMGETTQAAGFAGLDALAYAAGRLPPQIEAQPTSGLIHAETLVVPGYGVPDGRLEDALLTCASAGLFQPLTADDATEPAFFTHRTGALVLQPVLMDQAILAAIFALLPRA